MLDYVANLLYKTNTCTTFNEVTFYFKIPGVKGAPPPCVPSF